MWVCVSDRFEVRMVVQKLLEAATQSKQENFELEILQNLLRKEIGGKKYFLVLDDVWNEDEGKWSMVKNLLLEGAKGSRIVVATRSELVWRITCTTSSQPYFLEGLSKSQSLSLFKQIAFEKQTQTSNPINLDQLLETFGDKIVSRCAGVPLAIRAIGSLLRFKRTILEWTCVVENITQQGTGIEPILRLSYDQLPSHLKQCFAYCSLFPKDFQINKHVLTNLWMAQGFIQPSPNCGQSLEDVGHDYFMDFLWRSFFQEAKEDELGNIKSCKMHDLMHDLAKSVAGSECCSLMSLGAENVDENTRHVSLGMGFNLYSEIIPSALLKTNKMRTFIRPFTGAVNEYNSRAIIRNFRCSRMLDLRGSWLEKLPHCICKLKHLRYLDLSHNNRIRQLPTFVTRLQNLQTIDLSYCLNLKEWPTKMRNMVSLRHLDIQGCYMLKYMPLGLGQLTCLTSLKLFVLSQEDGCSGGLSELNGLNNLRGSLEISHLEKTSPPQIGTAYLQEKLYLDSLLLFWHGVGVDDEMVLESLRPHPNLKQLMVWWYEGAKFSNWLSFLPNLISIEIKSCSKCRNLPPMDHLPSSKFLRLEHLWALEYIETDMSPARTFFPSLQYLEISWCSNLKGWWKGDDEDEDSTTAFPCLSTLCISHCSKLTSFLPFSVVKNNLSLFQGTTRMSTPLSNLKTLRLGSIENVESVLEEILEKCHCNCLESLEIGDCSKLTWFPKEVQVDTSLRSLIISNCRNLMALPGWISNLTSLQELKISFCYELQSLPQWMSRLTNIRLLDIRFCPHLEERCQRDTGADWAQISHVLDIRIHQY